MKQLGYRAIMVLCFVGLLGLGTVWFCVKYAADGGDWAGSSVNAAAFSSGHISTGAIFDVNGVPLYDGESGAYAGDRTVRKATLHLVGDGGGNIATSARKALSAHLVGFNPVTGTGLGGHKLYMTVDSALNAAAYQALNGKKGAVAIYNYRTGDVLCMVSAPAFDPADPPDIREGDSAYEGVYINRFLSGLYVPGSVFKLVTTAAALKEKADIGSFQYACTGSDVIDGQKITCTSAHGTVDLAGALAKSCNCAYAALAVELGGETLQRYFDTAGLGESLSVNGIRTAAGSFAIGGNDAELGWSGVGQYQDLVNPCALLRLMGAIANGGVGVTPNLISRETLSNGLSVPTGVKKTSEKLWDAATCDAVKKLMRNDVTAQYGQKMFGELAVCAKSGTAEVGAGQQPHAWFAGFVDDAAVPLAFVVVVENGGSGTAVAGSIAARLLTQAAAGLQTGNES